MKKLTFINGAELKEFEARIHSEWAIDPEAISGVLANVEVSDLLKYSSAIESSPSCVCVMVMGKDYRLETISRDGRFEIRKYAQAC